MVFDEFDIHPEKDSERKIVDWERTYFLTNERVNSISPGWIDTNYTVYEGSDAVQQPSGCVGDPLDIANMVLFLCSDKAGFITGESICIDGGMTKLMIYHGDNGWSFDPDKFIVNVKNIWTFTIGWGS